MFRNSIVSEAVVSYHREINPGRLYGDADLRELLPPPLRRIVIARLQPIADLYLGQAIIEVLAREYLQEVAASSPTASASDVMTLAEVAEYLHVSVRTVRRMVEHGQLTAEDHRAPGTHKALLRFSRAQIDKDRKKAATSFDAPPVKPKFRL